MKLANPVLFLSTLSLRRATSSMDDLEPSTTHFYPRSPCGERLCLYRLPLITLLISIHALLAESDDDLEPSTTRRFTFLSTLSLRRATVHYDNYNLHCVISIHALLAESDQLAARDESIMFVFLSTLSLRRATVHYDNYNLHCVISIHALLAESDKPTLLTRFCLGNFYPRSPCGERRKF